MVFVPALLVGGRAMDAAVMGSGVVLNVFEIASLSFGVVRVRRRVWRRVELRRTVGVDWDGVSV